MPGSRSKAAPQWLQSITPETQMTPRLASQLLRRSFFYAASGSDMRTISQFADRFCSFVCVDLYPPAIENFERFAPPNYRRLTKLTVEPGALVQGGWPPYSPPYEGVGYDVPSTIEANLWIYQLNSYREDIPGCEGPCYRRIAVLMIYGECITTFEALYVNQKICPAMVFYSPCMEGYLNVAMLRDGQPFPRLLERLPKHKPGMLDQYNEARASYGAQED
jgi:hypothetical protein